MTNWRSGFRNLVRDPEKNGEKVVKTEWNINCKGGLVYKIIKEIDAK